MVSITSPIQKDVQFVNYGLILSEIDNKAGHELRCGYLVIEKLLRTNHNVPGVTISSKYGHVWLQESRSCAHWRLWHDSPQTNVTVGLYLVKTQVKVAELLKWFLVPLTSSCGRNCGLWLLEFVVSFAQLQAVTSGKEEVRVAVSVMVELGVGTRWI